MDGVYAMEPPTPKPIPCDRMRCVTLVENELSASDRHITKTPIVDTQRATRGMRIIPTIGKGAIRYAIP